MKFYMPIRTSVKNEDDDGNSSAPKPEGWVAFYIDGVCVGTSQLSDGEATLLNVKLGTEDKHFVYAKFISANEGNYENAGSDEVAYGKVLPKEGSHYTVSEPDPDTGWYNEDYTLIITLTADSGFDQIWNGEEWAYQFTVQTESANGTVDILMRNSQTLEESNTVSLSYQMDLSAPSDIKMSAPEDENFDGNTNTYEIEFTAEDELAGGSSITWHDTEKTPHIVEPDGDGKFIANMTADEWKSVLRIEAEDAAGNIGGNADVGNRFIEISYPEADRIVDETNTEIDSGQCDENSESRLWQLLYSPEMRRSSITGV